MEHLIKSAKGLGRWEYFEMKNNNGADGPGPRAEAEAQAEAIMMMIWNPGSPSGQPSVSYPSAGLLIIHPSALAQGV